MSLGAGMEYKDMGGKTSVLRNKVVSDAIAGGTVILVAAGNESCALGGNCSGGGIIPKTFSEYIVVPCAQDGTICIGATSADETLASYSNYSSKKTADYRTHADINAPGTAIYSTWRGPW